MFIKKLYEAATAIPISQVRKLRSPEVKPWGGAFIISSWKPSSDLSQASPERLLHQALGGLL